MEFQIPVKSAITHRYIKRSIYLTTMMKHIAKSWNILLARGVGYIPALVIDHINCTSCCCYYYWHRQWWTALLLTGLMSTKGLLVRATGRIASVHTILHGVCCHGHIVCVCVCLSASRSVYPFPACVCVCELTRAGADHFSSCHICHCDSLAHSLTCKHTHTHLLIVTARMNGWLAG